MPHVLKGLTLIGTVAMLWVGGGIFVHGLEHFGLNTAPHVIEKLSEMAGHTPGVGSVAAWLTFAICSAVIGFVLGGLIVAILHFIPRRKH
jgi:predicted DNA repair protein MutK